MTQITANDVTPSREMPGLVKDFQAIINRTFGAGAVVERVTLDDATGHIDIYVCYPEAVISHITLNITVDTPRCDVP